MRHLHVVLQVAAWLIALAWLFKLVEAWRGLAREYRTCWIRSMTPCQPEDHPSRWWYLLAMKRKT